MERAYAIVSAEGPSRAGPISERVVKPEALEHGQRKLGGSLQMKPTLDQDQPRKRLALAWTRRPVCLVYWTPWLWEDDGQVSVDSVRRDSAQQRGMRSNVTRDRITAGVALSRDDFPRPREAAEPRTVTICFHPATPVGATHWLSAFCAISTPMWHPKFHLTELKVRCPSHGTP